MNNPNRAKWPHSGITLVEVMIAMSLVAMVMGSAFMALGPAMRASENSRLNVVANEILLEEMERMRGLTWEEANELKDQDPFMTPVEDTRLATRILISERDRRDDQLQIILEVSWSDFSGKQQIARLVTFITQYGISA